MSDTKHKMNKEEKFILDAYGSAAEMPVVEDKEGFRLKIPSHDILYYLDLGWRIVPKEEIRKNN